MANSSSRGFAITGEVSHLRTFHAAAADAISYAASVALFAGGQCGLAAYGAATATARGAHY